MDEIALLGEAAVYPGHPVTLAWVIVNLYGSWEAASKPTKHAECPEAVANAHVPGAGGCVYLAMDLLKMAVVEKTPIEEVIALADEAWGRVDDMAHGGPYRDRHQPGQAQADKLKEALTKRLRTWPVSSLGNRPADVQLHQGVQKQR